MKVKNKNILDELLLMSNNIYRLYEKMIANQFDSKKNQKYLEYLDLALEYEDKLYKQINMDELDDLYFPFRDSNHLITYPIQEQIYQIPKEQLPKYRILFYLKDLKECHEEINIENIKYDYSNNKYKKMIDQLIQQIKLALLEGKILNQQLCINYINALLLTKRNSVEAYYHLIFLNKFLERELRFDGLKPMGLDKTFQYITKVWTLLPISNDIRRDFNQDLIKDILIYLNSNYSSKGKDESYMLACYFQLTHKEQERIHDEINRLLSSSNTNETLQEKILRFEESINQSLEASSLKKIFDINRKNI